VLYPLYPISLRNSEGFLPFHGYASWGYPDSEFPTDKERTVDSQGQQREERDKERKCGISRMEKVLIVSSSVLRPTHSNTFLQGPALVGPQLKHPVGQSPSPSYLDEPKSGKVPRKEKPNQGQGQCQTWRKGLVTMARRNARERNRVRQVKKKKRKETESWFGGRKTEFLESILEFCLGFGKIIED